LRPEGAQGAAGDQVALEVEDVAGDRMHGQETLSGPGRFEALHLALSATNRLVRNLGSVVLSLPLLMKRQQLQFGEGSAVRAQLVVVIRVGAIAGPNFSIQRRIVT
jgi:hypothetical protein